VAGSVRLFRYVGVGGSAFVGDPDPGNDRSIECRSGEVFNDTSVKELLHEVNFFGD
jgi:hypothetical protein